MSHMDESMLTDNEDQISTYYSGGGVSVHIPIEEVLDDLKCEVRSLSKQIITTRNETEMTNISLNPDRTVIVPERSVLLKRKTQIINNLAFIMEDQRHIDFPRSASEAINSYFTDVIKDAQSIEYSISQKIKQEEQLNTRLESLQKTESSIKNFENALVFEDNSMTDLEPEIIADFDASKRIFNSFLNLISPNGQLKFILEELVEKSSKEGDAKYLDITIDNFEHIQMLLRASLVVKHPLKPSKICLDDFS